VRRTAIMVILFLAASTGTARAQQGMGCGMAESGQMPGRMAMDQAMMARMDSLDVALDSLTKVMNAATGTRKTKAMAAVLNNLVARHLEMRRAMRHSMGCPAGMGGKASGCAGGGCGMMQGPGTDSVTAGTKDLPH
jgi:hypothetical protein